MAQCKADKLSVFLSLANLDPNLLLLITIIGHENFGTLVRNMGGMTITIPSITEIKRIAKQVKEYRRSFKKISKKSTALSNLATLGMAIDNKDVRTALKKVIAQIAFEAYLKSVYNDEESLFMEEEFESMKEDSKIDLYALSVKELEVRNNLLNNLNLLNNRN